jgi:hypothetical protein
VEPTTIPTTFHQKDWLFLLILSNGWFGLGVALALSVLWIQSEDPHE